MKLLLLAAVIAATSIGCRQLDVTLPGGGSLHSMSFVNKLSVGEVTVGTNGTVTLRNYNLDQVAGAQAIAQGVVQGMIAGGAKSVVP